MGRSFHKLLLTVNDLTVSTLGLAANYGNDRVLEQARRGLISAICIDGLGTEVGLGVLLRSGEVTVDPEGDRLLQREQEALEIGRCMESKKPSVPIRAWLAAVLSLQLVACGAQMNARTL